MPRALRDDAEELRKFRLPMVKAAHAAMKCKDCHFTASTTYRLEFTRRFGFEVTLLPCQVHQALVIEAMGKA